MRRGKRYSSRAPERREGRLDPGELEARRRVQDIRNREYVLYKLQDPFVQYQIREAVSRVARAAPAAQASVRNRRPSVSQVVGPQVFIDPEFGRIDRSTGEMVDYDCRRAKDNRRGSIISSGHGGHNGSRNYRKHEKC